MPLVKVDLHSHTIVSDGEGTPLDNVMAAVNAGLGALSITDHDTFRGSLEAMEFVKRMRIPILVIPGAEVSTDLGDVLVICGEVPSARLPRVAGELIDWSNDNNCLTIPAHPFDPFRRGVGDYAWRLGWSLVEVFNAGAPSWSNTKAMREAAERGVRGVANSDAHIPELVGISHSVVNADEVSIEGILDALLHGKVTLVARYPGLGLIVRRINWSLRRRIHGLLRKVH